ncbi:MAG: lipocalin family protein [Schleiferiaceae bacterium]
MTFKNLSMALGLFFLLGCSSSEDMTVVESVELEKYMGTWYDIAHFPKSFQNGCSCISAEYAIESDSRVSVVNSCTEIDGNVRKAEGHAYIADKETNAKLRVSFFWPFYGDYWIIDLAEDYSYALVGSPDRESLWVLARERTLPEKTFESILDTAQSRGFDITRIELVSQGDCPEPPPVEEVDKELEEE